MNIRKETITNITLELNFAEALWLKEYTQNDITENESPKEAEFRFQLFTILKANTE